jgi:hypothetical protein
LLKNTLVKQENILQFSYIFFFLLFQYGCTTTPVYLSNMSISPDTDQSSTVSGIHHQKCLVHISAVEDYRFNKQNLGEAAKRPVFVDDVSEWLCSGLRSLKDKGYVVSFFNDIQPLEGRTINLIVSLKAAYIRSVSTSECTTIMLHVKYLIENNPLDEKNYRGSNTSINWFSSESEINESFAIAFSRILDAISKDLSHYCFDTQNNAQ